MQFIYVDSSPPTSSKPGSIRQQELQQSLARRHAALHSHRARKSGISQKRHSKHERQQLATATQTPSTVQQWPLSPPPSPMSIDAILTPSTDASPANDDTVSDDHAPARNPDLSLVPASRLVMHRDHHGTRVDPFNSIPVETTSPIWNHVDYYLHCMSPAQSIVDNIFNVNSVYTTHWLRLLLQSGSLAACGMAGIESAMHSKRHPGEKLPRSTLELIGKALNLHRRHMQERNGKADGPAHCRCPHSSHNCELHRRSSVLPGSQKQPQTSHRLSWRLRSHGSGQLDQEHSNAVGIFLGHVGWNSDCLSRCLSYLRATLPKLPLQRRIRSYSI